jgi:hypothetical protein
MEVRETWWGDICLGGEQRQEESRVEISRSVDIGELGPCPIELEGFEIVLNWDIESALFGPMVIIVQFILGSNCVTIQN